MINLKDIRDDVVTRITGKVGGASVFSAKVSPNFEKDLPSVSVYTSNVSSTNTGNGQQPAAFQTTVDFEFEIAAAASTNWQDTVDDIVYDIKTTLFNDKVWIDQFEFIQGFQETYLVNDQGEQPIATATLRITCELVELL